MSSTEMTSSQTEQVSVLLDDLATYREKSMLSATGTRVEILARARSLIATLETPIESTLRIYWAEVSTLLFSILADVLTLSNLIAYEEAATRLAIDLGIFKNLAKDGGTGESCSQLASKANADPRLVGRILRHLASMSVIKEICIDMFGPSHFSQALAEPKYEGGVIYCFDCIHPSLVKIPAYFASQDYRNPDDALHGPFQYAMDTESLLFEWLNAHPSVARAFSFHMSAYNEGRPQWMDEGFYPIVERLEGVPKDQVLLVDVGGGMGHDLRQFKNRFPHISGRLILQETESVIAQLKQSSPGIEATIHDFFTPQPVKGAKAYYLHSILHNWNDDQCRVILENVKSAMKKGYSKILINDNIVPDTGASWQMTSLDWMLMAVLASSERTEAHWRELLESVGLKVAGIWTKVAAAGSLIEAVLEED